MVTVMASDADSPGINGKIVFSIFSMYTHVCAYLLWGILLVFECVKIREWNLTITFEVVILRSDQYFGHRLN